ncbi:MAG: metal ABC transporter permease [Alphaproteobacteria bacterium]|jgi:zinc transport system permease protein|nr:metal ABC transporter permease [Alphaproteobacteria bacterium]
MDDFLVRAMLGGIGVTLATGPLGCFVVWRRLAYFGAALSHSALLGVALGFLLGIDLTLGIFAVCAALTLLVVGLERRRLLASDTLMGILAHSALAAGMVAIAFMPTLRIDLMATLFGDVLAVSRADLVLIGAVALVVLAGLAVIWRPLLSATVHEDLAMVEGVPVLGVRILFMLMVALVIAVGMKIVGILLIVSLLILPAAAARRFAATPERMALGAVLIGIGAVVAGLFAALAADAPAGPSIVVVATAAFAASQAWPKP